MIEIKQIKTNLIFYVILLCVILVVKSALVFWLIPYSGIGLGPDEAQYWTWSRALDWGYYSKPPGIAWQIWAGTHIFGNTETGVRFFSLVISFFQSLSVFWLALASGLLPQTAFWAGVVMALTPLGFLGSIFAITDVGMMLFWTLSCIVVVYGLFQRIAPNYLLIGLLIASGALFKWPIYLLWPLIIIMIPFYRFLYSSQIFAGILISLLGMFPSVVWNASHNWVTFRHVIASITTSNETVASAQGIIHGNLLGFLGAQFFLLSPIIFVILLMAFGQFWRRFRNIEPPLMFCGITCFVLLVTLMTMSIFQKMQGNWVDYAYPTGIVFLCWVALEVWRKGKIWVQIGIVVSMILSIFALSIPYMQKNSLLSIPYKINPFRHNVGWNHLAQELATAGYDPDQHFLFGDKYQMSSILSFYSVGQKRAYFLNLHGVRLNQFSFWPSMAEEQTGKIGFFVLAENSPHLEREQEKLQSFYQTELVKYFREVQFLGIRPLFYSNGQIAKAALIFKCVDYNGLEPPPAPSLY